MKPGSFIINGVYSEDVGAVIQTRPVLNSPRRKVTFKEAYGYSGSLPYDEEAYDNTELELILYVAGGSATHNREIVYHLFDSGRYIDLILYSDPTKIYKVMLVEPPSFESRYYMGEGVSCSLKLSVLPHKRLVNSPIISITEPTEIYNPTLCNAKPTMAVYGSGDITLSINDSEFKLRNVTNDIILNSTIENSYQAKKIQTPDGARYDLPKIELLPEDVLPMNHKVYTRVYPLFSPGVNFLSWVGSVSRVDILPKWRTLA